METYDVKPTVLIFAHIWNFRNRKEKWAESNDFLVIEVSSRQGNLSVFEEMWIFAVEAISSIASLGAYRVADFYAYMYTRV